MTNQDPPPHKKRGMPRGMYLGSMWIGFAIFSLICWVLTLRSADTFLQQGLGDPTSFRLILIAISIFGFMFPMLYGLRMLRRAGRAAHQQTPEAPPPPPKETHDG